MRHKHHCFVIFYILPLFFWVSCTRPTSQFEGKYSTESAQLALTYAKMLKQDQEVTDAAWDSLFRTEGYRKVLTFRDSSVVKQAIKDAFILSMDKNRTAELDSLLAIPIPQSGMDMIRLMIIHNLHDLCNNLDTACTFLLTTNFIDIMERAHQKTKEFLPVSAYSSNPTLNDLYFICRWQDASVRANSVFFDLNMALYFTRQELIDILAHEYHHNYRNMVVPRPFEDPLLSIIDAMHAEGIADLIDKGEPPLQKMGNIGKEVLDLFNDEFKNTPQFLQTIDSITNGYVNGEIETEKFEEIRHILSDGGHAHGYYMALLIKKSIGMEDIIQTYDDPVAFVKLYNEAAAKQEGEYVFSPEFIGYLNTLDPSH